MIGIRKTGALAWIACALVAACGRGEIASQDAASNIPAPCGHAREACCARARCATGLECTADTCVARDGVAPPSSAACTGDTGCAVGSCPVFELGNAVGIVGGLAAGGDRVWWVSGNNVASVGYMDRCGGGGATASTPPGDPANVVADARGACWSVLQTLDAGVGQGDGTIDCFESGSAISLATRRHAPLGIALDDATVFWAEQRGIFDMGGVFSVPRAGGAPSHLADIAFSGEPALTIDHQRVYVGGGGGVLSVPKAGGTLTSLAQGVWDVRSVVVDDVNVYFSDVDAPHLSQPGHVLAVPKSGGATRILAAEDHVGNEIATDGLYVYYVAGRTVRRVPTSGGEAQTLATGAQPYALASDGAYIYFADLTSVFRVRSP